MQTFKQYETIEVTRDLNPIIKKGMKGVITDIWDSDGFEVEFVNDDGDTYQYNNQFTFTLTRSDIRKPSEQTKESLLKDKQKGVKLEIPKWLRYFLIIVAVLYFLWLILVKDGQQKTDFPFYRRY